MLLFGSAKMEEGVHMDVASIFIHGNSPDKLCTILGVTPGANSRTSRLYLMELFEQPTNHGNSKQKDRSKAGKGQ